MQITIDTESGSLVQHDGGREERLDLYSDAAFAILSELWLSVGWDRKYSYNFTWMGRPIIQLPVDLIRIQEVVCSLKPDVIVETGIAHGGSLVFYASLLKAMERGRIIGIDVDIRPGNRAAIEGHALFPLITLLEGSSIAPEIVERVHALVQPEETVLVVLDSNHTKQHVLEELRAYAPFVTVGSYIVAMDGVMEQVATVPHGNPDWAWDNPKAAAAAYVGENPDFIIETPPWRFSEGCAPENLTYWPGAFLKRLR